MNKWKHNKESGLINSGIFLTHSCKQLLIFRVVIVWISSSDPISLLNNINKI